MDMLQTALLATLAAFICREVNYTCGQCLCDRAMVVGLVTGLFFGDPVTGVIIGALLEVTFMGAVEVGGSATADPITATTLAVVFVVKMGMDQGTAVALAAPIGMLGGIIFNFIHLSLASFAAPFIVRAAETGSDHKVNVAMFGLGAIKYFISVLPVFFAILLGAQPMVDLIGSLPANVIAGLSASGSLLPAIGMGMLLKMLWDSKMVAFFFLGFIMVSYLGLSTVGVAAFGAVIVAIYAINGKEKIDLKRQLERGGTATAAADSDEEAFFA